MPRNRRYLDPSRRDLLRLAGAGGLSLTWGGCGDDLARPIAATLEVDESSAVIATWSASAGALRAVIETDDGTPIAEVEAATGDGGTAQLVVTGLGPGAGYRYRVHGDDGAASEPFHFVTAPADDRPVRIAVSADLDVDPLFDSPILDHLAAAGPDLFVSLGDFPYADNGPAAVTLDQYRDRHAAVRSSDKVQRWLRTTSLRAIYDDHEILNNWDAGTAARDPARHAAAMTAWDEWFPVRGAPSGARHRSWRWGPLVECFLLDCRRHRDDSDAPDGPGKVMLGEAQRQWLVAGIAASQAAFKLVLTSVPLDFGWGLDHWAGYRWERDAMLAAIRDTGGDGVLFVSADQHWFAAHRHASGVREFQVGPLARGTFEPPPAVAGVLARAPVYNFGLIDIDRDGDGPRLTFTAIDADGRDLYTETLRPAQLRWR